MVELQTTRFLRDANDLGTWVDPERGLDFLTGLGGMVRRLDELHPSTENDTTIVFVIWLREDADAHAFRKGLIEYRDPEDGWRCTATDLAVDPGMFLVTVRND